MRVSTRRAILGLACALGASTPAFAQEPSGQSPAPPPPAASDPPPADAPPADAPPAPPAPGKVPPAPPVTAPRVTFGVSGAPAASATEDPESPPQAGPTKPSSFLSRFAGSYVGWGQAASAELFGVGPALIGSEDSSYRMSWDIAPSFFAYRSARHDVRLRTDIGVSVELTNSNTTTRRNDAELAELPFWVADTIALASWGGENVAPPGPAAAFNPTLEGGSQYGTWLVTEGGVVFPTAPGTGAYRYLATTLGAGLRQRIKLLGGAAPGLQNVTLYLGETWRHDFNRTQVPVSSNVSVPRQSPGGAMVFSDVTSKWLLTTDRLVTSFGVILPIYGSLELLGGFGYQMDFKPAPPSSSCLQLATGTGCVDAQPAGSAPTTFKYTRFDLALAYRFLPELVVELGYDTFTSTLSQAGTPANPLFHTGDTVFYADVAVFPEQFLERFARHAPPDPSTSAGPATTD